LVIALYFGPIIFSLLISLMVVKSADKISFVPLFATTPYLIFWSIFYRKLHKRIVESKTEMHCP
jgi:hypothetical protein